jgi:hypothetical protein
VRYLELTPAFDPPFVPCNPSLVAEADGFAVNCRGVNYRQRRLYYGTTDPEGVYRTRNRLLRCDRDGRVLEEREVTLETSPLRVVRVQGLEDCRVVRFREALWATCATNDRHPAATVQQLLCRIDGDGRVSHAVPLVGRFDGIPQKNWLPFAEGDRLCAIHSYDPLIVIELDVDTGRYEIVFETAMPLAADHWRGSGGPVRWNGKRLLVIHEAAHRKGGDGREERVYVHRFVELDERFRLTRFSEPFVFAHKGIEFVCGLSLGHDDDVLLGLGIEDSRAFLCRIQAAEVERRLGEARLLNQVQTSGAAVAPLIAAGLEERIAEAIAPLHGWATPAKAARLAALVLETQAELSVEIGVFGGRGTIAMALAHRAQQRGVVAAVDPWQVDASLEGEQEPTNAAWWRDVDYAAIYAHFRDAIAAQALESYCRVIRRRSLEAVDAFGDGSVSVLHQDGNHSERVSDEEVIRWAPKIRAGGYWVADDTRWASTQRAQQRLSDLGFSLIEDHGDWRLYRKG